CSLVLRREAIGGTGCAENKDGKHELKRAPAAITSLSAASRCASRPPSDPSVQSPRNGTRSEMTGFSRIWGISSFLRYFNLVCCPLGNSPHQGSRRVLEPSK